MIDLRMRPFVHSVCVCAIHEIVTAFGVRKERFTFVTLLNHHFSLFGEWLSQQDEIPWRTE